MLPFSIFARGGSRLGLGAMEHQVAAWCALLRDADFRHDGPRLRALAAFVAKNGFGNVVQMKHATHPKKWEGAQGFCAADLNFLHELRHSDCGAKRAKSRSRHVCVFY